MQDDLAERRRAELEMVVDTAREESLSEQELLAWVRALNSLRLMLGTFLGVSEDAAEEVGTGPEAQLYGWLTYVQQQAVEALSGQT